MRTRTKALSLLLALIMLFSILPMQAMADEAGSKALVSVEDADGSNYYEYETLAAAAANAGEGSTIKLLGDLETTPVTLPGGSVLDLGGNTVTLVNPTSGSLAAAGITFKGGTNILKNGKIVDERSKDNTYAGFCTIFVTNTSPTSLTTQDVTIEAYQPSSLKNYNYLIYVYGTAGTDNLTLKSGTVIRDLPKTSEDTGTYGGVGIAFMGYSTTKDFAGTANLTVNEGVVINTKGYAISGNGTRHGTKITINGGELTSYGSGAIYHPQAGTLIMNGGTLTGQTGVQLCSGEGTATTQFQLNGGTVHGTGEDERKDKGSGDGLVSDGAAISLVNRNYPGGAPSIIINGGTFTSDHNDAVIAYTWGGGEASEWAEAPNFLRISGGIFSSEVDAYVVDGSVSVETAPGVWTIGAPVSGVTLNKAVLTIRQGGTETLTAAVEPANAADKTVTWTSDNEDVATVDEYGVVTAVGVGEATITAAAGGYTDSCTVKVMYATGEYDDEPDSAYILSGDICTSLRKEPADAEKNVAEVWIVYRQVSTLEELKAAEEDDAVAAVYIAGDIEVSGTVTVTKPMEIGTGKKLTVAEGGKLIATAGMQRLGFEDVSRVSSGNYDRMAAAGVFFLIGVDENGGIYRELLGSAADAAEALASTDITWNSAVLAADTTISGDVSVDGVYCPAGVTLTLAPGAFLTTAFELEPAAAEGYEVNVIQKADGHYLYMTSPKTMQVDFKVTPGNAVVEVTDLDGNVMEANQYGGYDLVLGRTYYYSVSAPGYVTKGASFVPSLTAAGGNLVTVTLSKQTSGGSSSGGGSSSSGTTKTETTKNPDGSTTATVTDTRTGTVTETVKTAEGVTGTTVTDKDGDVTKITASIPEDVAKDAAASGEAVKLPVEAPAVKDANDAAAISVTVPRSAGAVKVEIPVEKVTPGTVAVIVNADGTEEIVKTSVTTENGVALTLEGSATVKVIDNSKEFVDVHPVDHWAEASIDFVTSRELFNGKTADTFAPNDSTTRAQLMTVLARLDGADTTGAALEKGMAWAVREGISDGTNPSGTITRQQLAAMLYRYAGSPAAADYELTHSDAHKVSDYAVDAMRWAVANGIITGKTDGTLDPHGLATRAQVAAMMARFCAKMA